jgi:hypothetical protein
MRLINLRRTSVILNPIAGERWVMADFHIHSTYSGGSLTPYEILKIAHSHLLDVIAISDHNDIRGAEEVRKLAAMDPQTPQTILSQEISLGNHFHFLLIAGLQENWESVGRNQFMEKFAAHHQHGGAIILAHPWTMPKSSWAKGFLKEIISAHLLDAVELFNSSILELTPDNYPVIQNFWEEWAVPNQLAVVGGSDFHYHRGRRFPGSGRTYLKVQGPGEKGIVEALHNRQCVAGLFSYRPFDLGWLGKGNGVLFGADPWFRDLKRLIGQLQEIIKQNRYLKPSLKNYLTSLIEGGHYQMVRELLM